MEAVAFAEEAHRGQTRVGSDDPYVLHVLRVAHAAAEAELDEDAVIAALLHDTVEDCAVDLATVEVRFGPRVAALVHLLTKRVTHPTPSEKAAYYAGIVADDTALVLKVLDRLDNLAEMIRTPHLARWRRRYLTKTEAEFPPLLAALRASHPEIVTRFATTLEALRADIVAASV